MSDVSIEVGSLVLLVVVVLSSWLLSLLLSFSCWQSYRSTWLPTRHSYCPQCALQLESGEPAEERLGFRSLNGSRLASQFGREDCLLQEAGLRTGEVGWIQPGSELDRDTTVSRSFKRSPGGFEGPLVLESRGEERCRMVNKSKLSQVRILTSPSPRQKDLTPVVSRTPGNAARSWRRSVRSKTEMNMFNSLPKSLLEVKDALTSDTSCQVESEADLQVQQALPVVSAPAKETVLIRVGRKNVCSQETKKMLSQDRRDNLSKEKNWSDPKKERKKGSPGHTASAQYILDQYKSVSSQGKKPLTVDIVLDSIKSPPATERPRSKIPQLARKVSASAPPAPGDAKQKESVRQSHVTNKSHGRRDHSSAKTYRPGYSESDLTSQSEDEAKRGAWSGRGPLELPRKSGAEKNLSPQLPLDLGDLTPQIILPKTPGSLVPTPETARGSPGLPHVSLDLSSIHLGRSPVNISQPGQTHFSPANPQAHSSTNYSHEGHILETVSPTNGPVNSNTRAIFPSHLRSQKEPTIARTVSDSSQTGSWDLECQKMSRM